NLVQPNVASTRNVGETVYDVPMVATCTWVRPSPRPPGGQGPPAWPRLKGQVTFAFMMLYLVQIWFFSLRFQLTLTSTLLRFKGVTPAVAKLLYSPDLFAAGTRDNIFIMGPL